MALTSTSIPSLIDGISQQSPALRRASQAEKQVNGFSSVTGGLQKRPPAEHIVSNNFWNINDFYHFVDTGVQRYVIRIPPTDGSQLEGFYVYDLDTGTINSCSTGGLFYMGTTNPRRNLRALTIGNTTIFINRQVTIQLDDDVLTPARDHEAMVTIDNGQPEATYTARVKYGPFVDDNDNIVGGGGEASFTTGTSRSSYDTTNIASNLASNLDSNTSSEWTIRSDGNVILIENDSYEFTASTTDSWSDTLMTAITAQVDRFSDLPFQASPGFMTEVVGETLSPEDNYWVKFVKEEDSATVSGLAQRGFWEETAAPEVKKRFHQDFQPHMVQPDGQGGFDMLAIGFARRSAGDPNTAPPPEVVGEKLQDVFFYRGRLGFVGGNKVSMSGAGDLFNFWRTTATDLLDDDPINIEVSATNVSQLFNAVPFNDRLFLFSSGTQFTLDGGDLLTPRTVGVTSQTAFESFTEVRPIPSGQTLIFPFPRKNASGLNEYFQSRTVNSFDAVDVTSHVPNFIQGSVRNMAATTNENTIALLSDQSPHTIWVYKFFWDGNEKVQSSWSSFTFEKEVNAIEFLGSSLFIVTGQNSASSDTDDFPADIEILKISLSDQPSSTVSTKIMVDRKVSGLTGTYDSNDDQTTITIPYLKSSNTLLIRDDNTESGVTVPIVGTENTVGQLSGGETPYSQDLVVDGDFSGASFTVGEPYTLTYEFSPPFPRQSSQSNRARADLLVGPRYQIKRWRVTYSNTYYFKAEVELPGRSVKTYELGPSEPTSSNPGIDTESGSFEFPVLSRNDEAKVRLVNDSYTPSNFISAEFDADIHTRSRRF